MNDNVKYYIIVLKNIFLSDSQTDTHFGVYENGKYFDLLTNKEIYMVDNCDISKEEFINSKCSLIGIEKHHCDVSKISLFLKFMTRASKDILIDEVENMEKSIKNSLNEMDISSQNKVKKMKKEDFLINY